MNLSVYDIMLKTRHRMRLAVVSGKTLYHFRVTSANDSGEVAAPALGSFRTHPNTNC